MLIIFFVPVLIGLDKYQLNVGLFFEHIGIEDLYVNIFSLACILIIVLGIIELFKTGKAVLKTPLIIIIPIAVVLNTISLMGSDYLAEGLVFWLYFVTPFVAYFLGFRLLNSKKSYLQLLFTIIVSATIPILISIKQMAFGQFLFETDTVLPRLQGTFPHSNTFGSFIFIVATIYLVAYLSIRLSGSKKTKKKYWILPFLLLILFLILTYSRTALAGIVITAIILALAQISFRKPAFWGGTILAGFLLLFEKTRERLIGIFKREMFDSLWGRFEIWDIALFEFRKNRLTGYGIGSFEGVIKDAQGKETGNVYPHNDSIRFLLEGGMLGFLGYAFYMLGAIFYSIKSYLKYPSGEWRKKILGSKVLVKMKLLGICPLILFIVMAITSMVEAPSMDFTYQILAWTVLGSWLGTVQKTLKKI